MNMKQFKEFLDEEQLDELSSDTLKKYKTAAHKAIGDAAVKQHAGKIGSKEYHAHQDKRSKGINRADADKRLGTYKDKTPKHLDISANAKSIQKDGDRYRYNEENDMCNVCGQTPCNCTHIDELSNELLDRYKKKAGEAASAADKAKDFEKGHKRFKGIVKATFKQFANDAKK